MNSNDSCNLNPKIKGLGHGLSEKFDKVDGVGAEIQARGGPRFELESKRGALPIPERKEANAMDLAAEGTLTGLMAGGNPKSNLLLSFGGIGMVSWTSGAAGEIR